MRIWTSLLVAAGAARAVLVTEGSPCSRNCGNVLKQTVDNDMACTQADNDAGNGATYQSCLNCELTSDYSNDGTSDTQWMLYNMRFGISNCLFNSTTNNQCITKEACGPFENAIMYNNLSSSKIENYDYCAVWNSTDAKHLLQCRQCLIAMDRNFLANFFTVLQGACEQQPDFGFTVGIEGTLFSTTPVNITEPTPKATINPEWFDDGPINLSAKAGITGAGIVFVMIVVGFCIIWRGKRRRRAFLRDYETKIRPKAWPAPIQTRNMQETSDTPLSQRPLRSWDESPVTSEQPLPRYFSPYSTQYSSPVTAAGTPQPQYQQWQPAGSPQQTQQPVQTRNIGLAFVEDSPVDSDSKGKQPEESYEMHLVDSRNDSQYNGEVDGGHYPSSQATSFSERQAHHGHARTYSGSYRNFPGGRGQ